MVRFYCPECWQDFTKDFEVCPGCGFKIREFYERKDYVEKLIIALKSPVPEIPFNAALFLGRIKDARAVRPLIDCIENNGDVFIIREAIRALGEIGTMEAIMYLNTLKDHHSKMIRDEVQGMLNRLDDIRVRTGCTNN